MKDAQCAETCEKTIWAFPRERSADFFFMVQIVEKQILNEKKKLAKRKCSGMTDLVAGDAFIIRGSIVNQWQKEFL